MSQVSTQVSKSDDAVERAATVGRIFGATNVAPRCADRLLNALSDPRPSLDGIPTGDLSVDDRARLAEAIATYHRTGSTRAIELTVELLRSEAMHAMYMWKHARENARLDSLAAKVTAIACPRLAAIDQGTKHEQTRAEFLEDFNKKAEMEIHPFTPNPALIEEDEEEEGDVDADARSDMEADIRAEIRDMEF